MEFPKSVHSGSDVEKLVQWAEAVFIVQDELSGKPGMVIRDNVFVPKFDTNEELEKYYKNTLEADIPQADLEDIYLEYIPDYIRELKMKNEYWGKEFRYWKDIISEKNWKLYNKQINHEFKRHKKILMNMDKMMQKYKPSLELVDHFTESLDPERVQNLVTSIKENESDDKPFADMMREEYADKGIDLLQILYILYAIYARYGEFRVRPSRKNSLRVKEEDELILK